MASSLLGQPMDTLITRHSQLADLSAIHAVIEVSCQSNAVRFRVKADRYIEYNAFCSKWTISPLDHFVNEGSDGDFSWNDCNNLVSALAADTAQLTVVPLVDFIDRRNNLSRVTAFSDFRVMFARDTFITPSVVNEQILRKHADFQTIDFHLSQHDGYTAYSVHNGEYPLTVEFDLRPCTHDTGEFDGNSYGPEVCKPQPFPTTWSGHLRKSFVLRCRSGAISISSPSR